MEKCNRRDGYALAEDQLYTRTFISPAEAERKLKPLLTEYSWSVIAERIVKPAGALTLVSGNDPRPAARTDVKTAFSAGPAVIDPSLNSLLA